MTTISILEPVDLILAANAPDVFSSCSLASPSIPPEPPAPPQEQVIYTPVAPGIVYESLPEVVIVDTSPDQIIGCIFDTGNNAQGRLNASFPDAVEGDGVIERRTNDIWVFDGSVWNNVGPTPGPTIQELPTLILPYNETVVYDGLIRLITAVTKFEYALRLLTEVPSLTTLVDATVVKVNVIKPPAASIQLDALAPQISISARVDSLTASTSLTGLAPEVNTGKAIQIPLASLALAGLVPDLVGRPGPRVFVPSLDLGLAAFAPSISTGATVSTPSISLVVTGFKPVAIGKLDTEAFDLFLLIEDDLLSLRNP
jgi:hypothetical protein